MVLVNSLKSFAYKCNFMSKSTFSFSRCLVHSIVIMSLHASIVIMSSNNFQLVSTFQYSTSNFVLLVCKVQINMNDDQPVLEGRVLNSIFIVFGQRLVQPTLRTCKVGLGFLLFETENYCYIMGFSLLHHMHLLVI